MSKFYRVMHFLFAWLARIILNVRVHGLENEPRDRKENFIICANHICAADPVAVCAALRRHQPRYMSKAELFKIPVLNWILKGFGAFPVKRGGADVGAIKTSIKMLEEGKVVGIFPQGHRYPGVHPSTTPVKNGATMIALHSGKPIIPILIKSKNYKVRPFRRIDVVIGKPISVDELGYDPEKSGEHARISNYIFERICALEGELEK